ncbi:MetS family NSS transporter small subunit [candidate division WOR-3 bacterium]|nr:MetS family NSS transporter small subunit [candidate division WOR-3 bacterium]MCK4528179.1 MetS family NSS transporter small subunit [candidate division WOR-3 bacterium]
MNGSAIVMLIFASLILYGGLGYYLVRAARGKKRKNSEETTNESFGE